MKLNKKWVIIISVSSKSFFITYYWISTLIDNSTNFTSLLVVIRMSRYNHNTLICYTSSSPLQDMSWLTPRWVLPYTNTTLFYKNKVFRLLSLKTKQKIFLPVWGSNIKKYFRLNLFCLNYKIIAFRQNLKSQLPR